MSAEDENAVRKYRLMLKAGVPSAAVALKMRSEGVEERLIRGLCGDGQGTGEPAGGEGSRKASKKEVELDAADESKVQKYRAMLKAGVPAAAVRLKMLSEGVERRLVQALFPEDRGSSGGEKVEPPVKTPAPNRRASKLLTLHWTPLGLSKEQLDRTVWAKGSKDRVSLLSCPTPQGIVRWKGPMKASPIHVRSPCLASNRATPPSRGAGAVAGDSKA